MTAPYYQDDLVTLYHGSYLQIPDRTYDAIVTDPPYGETSLAWDHWPESWPFYAAPRASSLWCFGSMRMFLDHRDEFLDAGWRYAQEIVWEKHNGSGFAADRFKRVHEFATHWYQGKWADLYNVPPTTPDAVRKTTRRKSRPPHTGEIAGSYYTSEDGGDRLMRSVIKLRSMHGRAINETEKPVQLASTLIKCSVPPGGVVLDMFAGSASTGIAARQLGVHAVLVELRESQCEKAARRLERETAQPFDFGDGAA